MCACVARAVTVSLHSCSSRHTSRPSATHAGKWQWESQPQRRPSEKKIPTWSTGGRPETFTSERQRRTFATVSTRGLGRSGRHRVYRTVPRFLDCVGEVAKGGAGGRCAFVCLTVCVCVCTWVNVHVAYLYVLLFVCFTIAVKCMWMRVRVYVCE